MITQVKQGWDYIFVGIPCCKAGALIDPSSIEAWFCKVSQTDGSLVLDTNIGSGTGKITLTKQMALTGIYGTPVHISSLSPNIYVVMYFFTISGISSSVWESFTIDESMKLVSDINTSVGIGIGTNVNAIEASVGSGLGSKADEIIDMQKGGFMETGSQMIWTRRVGGQEICRKNKLDKDGNITTGDDVYGASPA